MVSRKTKVAGVTVGTLVVILGALLIFAERAFNTVFWIQNGFDMSSFSPWVIPVSLGALAVYWVITLWKRRNIYYTLIGVSWTIAEFIWLIGMLKTYWGIGLFGI